MSAHELRIRLTRQAQRDLRDIRRYGLEVWGTEQTRTYRERLMRVVDLLSAQPMMGRSRDDIAWGLRSFPAESHVIFYRVSTSVLTIVAIAHAHSDMSIMRGSGESR